MRTIFAERTRDTVLATGITALAPADGGFIEVQDASDLPVPAADQEAYVTLGTGELSAGVQIHEPVAYSGVDTTVSPHRLTGIRRVLPRAWDPATTVQHSGAAEFLNAVAQVIEAFPDVEAEVTAATSAAATALAAANEADDTADAAQATATAAGAAAVAAQGTADAAAAAIAALDALFPDNPDDAQMLAWNEALGRWDAVAPPSGGGLSEPVTFTQDVTFDVDSRALFRPDTMGEVAIDVRVAGAPDESAFVVFGSGNVGVAGLDSSEGLATTGALFLLEGSGQIPEVFAAPTTIVPGQPVVTIHADDETAPRLVIDQEGALEWVVGTPLPTHVRLEPRAPAGLGLEGSLDVGGHLLVQANTVAQSDQFALQNLQSTLGARLDIEVGWLGNFDDWILFKRNGTRIFGINDTDDFQVFAGNNVALEGAGDAVVSNQNGFNRIIPFVSGTGAFDDAMEISAASFLDLRTRGGAQTVRVDHDAGGSGLPGFVFNAADDNPANLFWEADNRLATLDDFRVGGRLIGPEFSRGAVLKNEDGVPTGVTNVWRAPFPCTVQAVKALRVGGAAVTANARRNGADDLLAADMAAGDGTWADGGAVQNATFAEGDTLQIEVVTSDATEVGVQIDFVRA